MKKEIDFYEQEVKKVYPDAVCNCEYYPEFEEYGYEIVSGRETIEYATVGGPHYAWQSAYNKLNETA